MTTGAVVARRREPATGSLDDRDAMRAVDASDLAEEFAVGHVDDHDTILPANEDAVLRGIGHDVVPASGSADRIRVRDPVRHRRPAPRAAARSASDEDTGDWAHRNSWRVT